MDNPSYIKSPEGTRIAYRKLAPLARQEHLPEIVFLGGYASDMRGTKAEALHEFARAHGYGFLRMDYRGHGESDGDFLAYGISDWLADALTVIETEFEKPFILVGSSMGGWLALRIAQILPQMVNALVTIAAAPDFTEDFFWENFTETEKLEILAGNFVERPSGYEEPYRISPKLIEQGRENLVMRSELKLTCPVRLLQGLKDASVSNATALRLAEHINCDSLKLELVKHSDHSFSKPSDLALLFERINEFI